jgi:hypothetical protein
MNAWASSRRNPSWPNQVSVPSETGPITVTLAEVSGLPAKIKEWIKGA